MHWSSYTVPRGRQGIKCVYENVLYLVPTIAGTFETMAVVR